VLRREKPSENSRVEPSELVMRQNFGIVSEHTKVHYSNFMMIMMMMIEMVLNKSLVNVTVGFPPKTYRLPAIGQWLVVQQRLYGNLSFYQNWTSYKHGL